MRKEILEYDKTWGIKDMPKINKEAKIKEVAKTFLSKETLNDPRFQKVRAMQTQKFLFKETHERSYGGISKMYYRKALVYGDFIDLLIYDKAQITHTQKGRISYAKKLDTKKRDDSIARTKQNIFRIVHSNINKWGNYKQIFYTLTFKENLTDVKIANKHFGLFIKRLEYNISYKIKHITVVEFQKRGAVHYHGIFFNLDFIPVKEFERIWGHGFTKIETFETEKAISSYLTKYINKESNDQRLYGQRSYLASKDLYRPKETFKDEEIDYILNTPKEEIGSYGKNEYDFFRYQTGNTLNKEEKSDTVTNNKS